MPDQRTLYVGGTQYKIAPAMEAIRFMGPDGTTVLFKLNASGITTPAGEIINSVVQPAGLSTNLRKGFAALPLGGWRLIASNDIPAIAVASGNGGNLGVDTAPKLIRVNGATDKQERIQWAAASVIEITHHFVYPPDLDDTATLTVNLLMNMGGASDTPTVAVSYWENIGDTDAGGATAAITGTTLTQYTRTIAASDVGAYPAAATITLIPGTHGTDVANLYGSWIEYTRKA